MHPAPPEIRPLAAVHLREALTALQSGDQSATVAALMHIDAASWQAIEHRLNLLGTTLPQLLTHTATTATSASGGTP